MSTPPASTCATLPRGQVDGKHIQSSLTQANIMHELLKKVASRLASSDFHNDYQKTQHEDITY